MTIGAQKSAIILPALLESSEKRIRQLKYEEGMEKIRNLVGLENVKRQIFYLVSEMLIESHVESNSSKAIKPEKATYHMVFQGNPGAGKTEIARCFPDILYGLNITKGYKCIETNRSELVGAYIGQTEKATREKIEDAINNGGVLFIDEFHQLGADSSSWDYGKKAISVLVSFMENYRDDFVCIIAGYPREIKAAIACDPGLKSRFNIYIDFPDYSTDEMFQIFKYFSKKNNRLIDELKDAKAIKVLIKGIEKLIEEFEEIGNARAMRKLFEKAKKMQAVRLVNEYFPDGYNCSSSEKLLIAYKSFSTEDINLALEELRDELIQQREASEARTIGFGISNHN